MKLGADTIRREQGALFEALGALERIASTAAPLDLESLSAARWAFTRDIMLHFSHMSALYGACGRGSGMEYRSSREQRAMRTLVEDFQNHAARWHGAPGPDHWEAYRAALRTLIDKVYDRLLAESEFVSDYFRASPEPIDVHPEAASEASAKAWSIRTLIFDAQNRPVR